MGTNESKPDQAQSPRPEWEFNTGENRNIKGKQGGGNIKLPPTSVPQNGRFVCSTGKNYNEGDDQKGGNVEFGKDGSGAP